MTAYAYRAVDSSGRTIRGRVDAPDPRSAERAVERRGLFLVDLDEDTSSGRSGFAWPGSRRRQLLELTRSVSALVQSGMPVARAVRITETVIEGEAGEALARVHGRLERGDEIADALASESGLFPPVYVGVVRAGARSGDLDGAFRRLTDHLEREAETRGQVVSSLVYPGALALFGGASILVILLFVVPRFSELLVDAGASVPPVTAALVGLSGVLRDHWLALGGGAVAGLVLGVRILTTDRGRAVVSRLLLRSPVIGPLQSEILAARFARLASVLVRGGSSLLAALDEARAGVGDPVAEAELARVRARVREGERLNGALARGDVFPELLVRLVAVGEESGRIGEFLGKAAEIFEERVQRSVRRVVVLLEPALIVFFGGLVALVALALLQAIYGVNAGVFR